MYLPEGVSQTITAGTHGYGCGNLLEITSCAMRGRYDENGKTNQNLELNSKDYSNCITSVEKDSLILEVN